MESPSSPVPNVNSNRSQNQFDIELIHVEKEGKVKFLNTENGLIHLENDEKKDNSP